MRRRFRQFGLLAAWGFAACGIGGTTVCAAELWWQPTAFAGQNVRRVDVVNGVIHADVDGVTQASNNGGVTWYSAPFIEPPPPSAGWIVNAQHPALRDATGIHTDATAPDLGMPGFVTSPRNAPDFVVAVDSDSVVWRRDPRGYWSRALLLLPDHLGAPSPRVTGVASFQSVDGPGAVYLASAGFGVLESSNGGVDWVRFDPGLPADVGGLGIDDGRGLVLAATATGLYQHRLRALPAVPDYRDAAYWWRVAGMAVVTLAATAAAVVATRRLLAHLPVA